MKLPYDYDLTNKITQASNRERNEQLYPRVMAGDEQAREEMIEYNVPLVIFKVDSYIACYPEIAYLRDDLHSEGFVGLVQAVNRMVEHKAPPKVNPTGYISIAITHEIARFAEKESAMGITSIPDTENGPDVPKVVHDVPESVVDTRQSAASELLELRDLLESCCESDDERTLIRMREEGYSDRDIAKALNMPHTAAYTLRKELEQRFNQKCHELEK